MSRVPRIQVEDAVYYVMPTGNHDEPIFRNDEDYALYLELLSRYKNKHDFELFAFCLAPNSISLLIAPSSKATISQIMHDLNPNYTKYFNGKHNRAGRLFQERYRMVLIEKAPNLLKMTAYIHLKPKLLRLTDDISSYKYTSFLKYSAEGIRKPGTEALNDAQGDKLNMAHEVAHVLGCLKDKSYWQFVNEMGSGEVEELDKALEKEKVIGSEEFCKEVWSRIESEREAPAAAVQSVSTEKPGALPQHISTEKPCASPLPAPIEKPHALPQPVPVEKSSVAPQSAPIKKLDALPQSMPIELPYALPQPVPIDKPPVPPKPVPIEKPPVTPQSTLLEKPPVLPKSEPIEKPPVPPQPVPIEKPPVPPKPIPIEKPCVSPQPAPTQIPKTAGRPASNATWIFAVVAYLVILFFALSVFFAYTNIQRMKKSAEQEITAKETELESRLTRELDKASKDLSNAYEAKLASYQTTIEHLETGKRKAEDDLRKSKDDLRKYEDKLQKAEDGWQKSEDDRLKAEDELSKARLSPQP